MKMEFTMIRKALLIIEENEPCSLEPLKTLGLPEQELEILVMNLRDAGYVSFKDISDTAGFDIMDLFLLPEGRNSLDFTRCRKWYCSVLRFIIFKFIFYLFSIEFKKPALFRSAKSNY